MSAKITGPYLQTKQTPSWTNKSGNYVVIIGCDSAMFEADGDNLSVADTGGTVIDGFELEVLAAGTALIGLPRRMLVPPNGQVTSTNAVSISILQCFDFAGKTSLEWAVAALGK